MPCSQDLALRWHTEIESPILASPLITDLYSDGRKDIIVPGLHGSLVVLDGRSGGQDVSFEGNLLSNMHVSPLLHDVDLDGVPDIVAASYDGKIQFLTDKGDMAAYPLTIPRLRVEREWYKDLDADPVDHSHPDVGADPDDSGIGERLQGRKQVGSRRRLMSEGDNKDENLKANPVLDSETAQDVPAKRTGMGKVSNDKDIKGSKTQNVLPAREISDDAAKSFSDLFGKDNENHANEENTTDSVTSPQKHHPWLNKEVWEKQQRAERFPDEDESSDMKIDARAHPGLAIRDYDDEYTEEEEDYLDDYEERSREWHDSFSADDFEIATFGEPTLDYVWIDPHILATPSIGDIDNDGHFELVVAVSYFFDPETYASDSMRTTVAVGKDGDPDKYLASGVVVFDLLTRGIKWSQHLDLSTRYTRYKALAQSPPTLADIDGDGRAEIIVGTSMGFVYVLDPGNGEALEGWPIQMGDVEGRVIVGDVDNDGKLEVIAGDARGSIAVFRNDGREFWEKHIGSAIEAGITLGDINSDGNLEIIFGTFDGRVFALNGRDGLEFSGFPFRSAGRITAPILPIKLSSHKSPYLELAFTSHDGLLYVLGTEKMCADTVDLGEPSFSMVLAEDVSGSGMMDLVTTTSSGSVYSFRTSSRYHPLKSWTSESKGVGAACCTSSWNLEGIYALAASRVPRDVRGFAVPVRFRIMDERKRVGKSKSELGVTGNGPYKVSIILSGVGVKEMNSGDAPAIGVSNVFNSTGTFTMEIPCPRTRTTATIRLLMEDESGNVFVDEFALSFHMHFYRLLKWVLVGPLVFSAAVAFLGGKALRDLMPQLPS